VREIVPECRANGRWIGPECFQERCPPIPRGAGRFFWAAPCLSVSPPFGDWFAIARRAHYPLPVDCTRGMDFLIAC
jgi:hypothetical protein